VAPTVVGRWLAAHRDGRPTIVHAVVLAARPRPLAGPYAAANRTSYFRALDDATALQLAAGLYAERPHRARAPLAAGGDVDIVTVVPATLPAGSLCIVPAGLEEVVAARHAVRREAVLAIDGRPFAVVLQTGHREPRPAPTAAHSATGQSGAGA
jgi:hypothetical protein